ncbi:U11/U12 small nuclear ribonucleoprotein 48 kDa protein-like [Salvelinus namaycush]|uniref:U11/U12 small nuclear ribonucleoprotein 48 kDa protein-like n=1 Tax=Salvelinus namaycush TaxID=8040 RepID=A0A8U0QUX4_SALNM|nr:U11/U12 small nuclear ribonucleoprotein 48 kDa protein-like [Salvelinus namaycush]
MCDSPENHQARLRSLEELTEFTENCQRQLNELFETLGWRQDQDNCSVQEPMEVCPYDPNHRVPSRSMERHKATCQLSQIGYSHEEQAEMYDHSLCYENTSITSFTMDKHTQQQVIIQARASAPPIRTEGLYSQSEYSTDPSEVPQNQKRAICDLTVADRLALFDHVTREGIKQKDQAVATNNEDLYVDLVAKLKKGNDQNEHKSHLELMAEMRDYKRRRQSYRAKNVHNTKKSYTEVIREVINVHSVELSSQWKEEERKEEVRESKHGPHRRRSEDRWSASIESRQSHVSSRDGHVSHHKRHISEERRKDPSPEQSQGRSREKERKKKRKRDSCSPDERPHDRKKKKKKKKEEK